METVQNSQRILTSGDFPVGRQALPVIKWQWQLHFLGRIAFQLEARQNMSMLPCGLVAAAAAASWDHMIGLVRQGFDVDSADKVTHDCHDHSVLKMKQPCTTPTGW